MLDLSKVWPEWIAEEKLGEGAYGSVYKCVRRERGITSYCAIKVITVPHDSSELDSLKLEGYTDETSKEYFNDIVDNFSNEISVMENLKGLPNIVSVEDFKIIEHTDNIGWDIYIRMELLTSLKRYLESHALTQNEVLKFGKDICTALEICEENRIIHRDIKEDNIFVDKRGNFKLGDFGIAKQLERTRSASSHIGAYAYMAPEVSINGRCDKRADIYSLGIVMYKLLNKNRDPFLDTEKQMIRYQERVDAVNRRLDGETLPKPVNADDAVADIILKACKFNKEDRYSSATEMKTAIEGLLTVSKKNETEPSAEEPAVIQEEIAEAIKSEQTETENMPSMPASSKSTKKIIAIVAAVVAIGAVVAIVLGIKFLPNKNSTLVKKETTASSATQNDTEGVVLPESDLKIKEIYENFLSSEELQSTYPEINALIKKDKSLCTEEQIALLEHFGEKNLSESVVTKNYLDLDNDGVEEMLLSLDLNGQEDNMDFYVFDIDAENKVRKAYQNGFFTGTSWYGISVMQDENGQYYFINFTRLFGHTQECEKLVYNGTEMVVELSLAGHGYSLDGMAIPEFSQCTVPGKSLMGDTGDYPEENEIQKLKYEDFCNEWRKLFDKARVMGCCDSIRFDLIDLFKSHHNVINDDISWVFYENGFLLIEGTGAIPDYDVESAPWMTYSDEIKSVVIKEGITKIGDEAFCDCINLTSIIIPESITTIGNSAFNGCISFTSVTIPDSVTTIGGSAFADCDNLKSVTIPDSVTSIGDSAFSRCDSLTSVSVDTNNKNYSNDEYGVLFNKNKTTLIQYPMGNTKTRYTIPNSVTTIGDSAFYFCTSLTSVTMPDSVTSIGDSAFAYCASLTSVTIGNSVTSIGYCAFSDCDNLTDVYYAGGLLQWSLISVDKGNEPLTKVKIHYYS